MKLVSNLKIKLYADGADRMQILKAQANPLIKGFTTNPSLMRAAGVSGYEAFARAALEIVTDRPISFEVFADEFHEMERQARLIASWGENVYVKIPVTNTRRESTAPLVKRLAETGVKVNVTAAMTLTQVREAAMSLAQGAPSVISVFAGRIADTGRDPVPMMSEAVALLAAYPQIELLWASPREVLNIFQANDCGCHIITATENLLSKLSNIGRDLDEYSLETVLMFHTDAVRSGYQL
jgi:transaldolase